MTSFALKLWKRRKKELLSKYCSIILILFISFYAAFLIRRRSHERIKLLEELCRFIEYIEDQIEYFCMPTEDIVASYTSQMLEEYGFLPLRATDNWCVRLRECGLDKYLDDSCLEYIQGFSDKLGRSCAEEQIDNCRYTLKLLSKRLKEARNDIPKRAKVYSALCVVSAFMAAILII